MILSILFSCSENVVVITNKQQNYIVIVFLTDNTQIIEPLHNLCCVNDKVQLKNNKHVILIYLKEMIRKLLQY